MNSSRTDHYFRHLNPMLRSHGRLQHLLDMCQGRSDPDRQSMHRLHLRPYSKRLLRLARRWSEVYQSRGLDLRTSLLNRCLRGCHCSRRSFCLWQCCSALCRSAPRHWKHLSILIVHSPVTPHLGRGAAGNDRYETNWGRHGLACRRRIGSLARSL